MPEPTKPALTGDLQQLVRLPDAVVLIVDDKPSYATAVRYFPNNPVFSWLDMLPYVGVLERRNVIVWPAAGGVGAARWMELRPELLAVAGTLRMVGVAKQIAAMTQREAMQTLREPGTLTAIEQPLGARVEAPAKPQTVAVGIDTPALAKKPRKPPDPRRPSWKDMGLILSTQGNPMPTLDNAVRVLEHDPALAGQVWYDAFLGRVLHTWGVDSPAQWTDADDLRLTLYLQRDIGISKMAKGIAADAAYAYARRETRNCAYDWLDGLRWDGVARLQDLASRGFGSEPSAYNAAVCRNMILAMVKRVFEPGCKSDYMPILEGDQGVGKSQALGILGGAWFAELHISWENKDFFDALRGKMLLEIGEMHAFRQSDVDRVKGIVSCATDRYRASYGRHTEDYPRCCVFVGTTNRDDWNRDDTGARRFWPVKCGVIDHQWLRDNREQLFAEAVHEIRAGSTHWEVPWTDARIAQDERRAPDTWEEKLAEYVIGKSRLLMVDVLDQGLGIEVGRQTLGDQQRAGRCLKKIGWRKTYPAAMPGKSRQKIWVREDDSTDPNPELFVD